MFDYEYVASCLVLKLPNFRLDSRLLSDIYGFSIKDLQQSIGDIHTVACFWSGYYILQDSIFAFIPTGKGAEHTLVIDGECTRLPVCTTELTTAITIIVAAQTAVEKWLSGVFSLAEKNNFSGTHLKLLPS